MKPSYISNCDRITSHYLKAANTMTLPTSQKTTRETALLYGAWTILILSMLAMVLPISNSRSALGSAETNMIEAVNTEVAPR
jgi:hypothetical protein